MMWMIINEKIKGVYIMQSTIEIKHLSRKEKLRMMEAIGKTCREKMKRLNPLTGIKKLCWKLKVGLVRDRRKLWIGKLPKGTPEPI